MGSIRLTTCTVLASLICLTLPVLSSAQDQPQEPVQGFDDIQIPENRLPVCFGFSDIQNPRALAVCDALNLNENVRARELTEQWVREQPDNPAAQFALAEVLFTVEGNLARALFHLDQAEALTGYNTLEEALTSGNLQWHYLTLSQLSYVHQLMGNQIASLDYLDKINQIYGQDIESFRGWPLIKLKEYEAARESANRVLESSEDSVARARAWNTLCAVELASLEPLESMNACDQTLNENGEISDLSDSVDTVYLTNASEVSLSLLNMKQAEAYLQRATRYLNPDSVADPWVYLLYLLMNQGRFDEANAALDRMLVWRDQQEPIVTVMNRAEHFMVSAGFLLLAGYTEDAAKLSTTALNQPDRNGSYSADDAQKDSYAALMSTVAISTAYQVALERAATLPMPARQWAQLEAQKLRLDAWRTGRRAASLFADFDVLQGRLRPYAPLDVHIPEWLEPHIVELIGPGVMSGTLNQARANGAFQLNEGYYYSYRAEIAALRGDHEDLTFAADQALSLLPAAEVLLRARITLRLAESAWQSGLQETALELYARAWRRDPGLLRRLGMSLPVQLQGDGSELGDEIIDMLGRSPRFDQNDNGLPLVIGSSPQLNACLRLKSGELLSCYNFDSSAVPASPTNGEVDITQDQASLAAAFSLQFQDALFGLGYDISRAQRSRLLGSSVILSSQTNANLRNSRDAFMNR